LGGVWNCLFTRVLRMMLRHWRFVIDRRFLLAKPPKVARYNHRHWIYRMSSLDKLLRNQSSNPVKGFNLLSEILNHNRMDVVQVAEAIEFYLFNTWFISNLMSFKQEFVDIRCLLEQFVLDVFRRHDPPFSNRSGILVKLAELRFHRLFMFLLYTDAQPPISKDKYTDFLVEVAQYSSTCFAIALDYLRPRISRLKRAFRNNANVRTRIALAIKLYKSFLKSHVEEIEREDGSLHQIVHWAVPASLVEVEESEEEFEGDDTPAKRLLWAYRFFLLFFFTIPFDNSGIVLDVPGFETITSADHVKFLNFMIDRNIKISRIDTTGNVVLRNI
jgi:hypothetical protein